LFVPRGSKKKAKAGASGFSLFDDSESVDSESDEDLPRDEIGRHKIKQQYIELLGIRVQKLSGRILNRERIDKNVEGIYFICVHCKQVCHNLDEGLIEDEENEANICVPCSKAKAAVVKPARSARSGRTTKRAPKKRG
jgi:hypothetical protein